MARNRLVLVMNVDINDLASQAYKGQLKNRQNGEKQSQLSVGYVGFNRTHFLIQNFIFRRIFLLFVYRNSFMATSLGTNAVVVTIVHRTVNPLYMTLDTTTKYVIIKI